MKRGWGGGAYEPTESERENTTQRDGCLERREERARAGWRKGRNGEIIKKNWRKGERKKGKE